MKPTLFVAALLLATPLFGQTSSAQIVTIDPVARLREVLPPDVAQRVLDRIADARAGQLPAEALENRALKFAAKGVAPLDIERSVSEHVRHMTAARDAIASGRSGQARADEIEAGAEAIRKGVDGAAVSRLAKAAPNRALAIPLFVIGSLADRGLPSDEALERVLNRLEANASDADLARMPADLPARASPGNAYGKDKATPGRAGGRKPAAAGRPASPGKPSGIPGNAGGKPNPGQGKKPPRT